MNINDNKSSQSHPGPTRQLPSYQLDYVSDLSIALFNISLKYMQDRSFTQYLYILTSSTQSDLLWMLIFVCTCAHRKSVVLYGVRYFAGPVDTGRTDHNLTRPQQHPLVPGHLKQAELNAHDALIIFYMCTNVCVFIPLSIAPFPVLWRLWCSSALCFQPAEATSRPFPKKHDTNF